MLAAEADHAPHEEDDLTSDACPFCGTLGNGEPCVPHCPVQEG
jgi:hypothetical protein